MGFGVSSQLSLLTAVEFSGEFALKQPSKILRQTKQLHVYYRFAKNTNCYPILP